MARGWRGILVSTLLVVSAGCSAAQQQQQAALPSATADEVFTIIARAVQQELRPVVRKLESRVESLNNRLTLQMEELSSQLSGITARLDSQLSQLSELNTQLNEQKSQQEETAATVDGNVERLESNVTWLENQLTKVIGLANRLDSQQSPSATQESIDRPASEVKQLPPPRDCSGLPVDSPSGVYLIRPSSDSQQPPVEAYCDMDTAGGNWTVIQRRDDMTPRQDFNLGWTDYKEGFGNLTKEFWWGLEHLFQLTSSNHRRYELRIELQAFDGSQRYATYQGFRISSEEDGYTLSVSDYSGTAGNGLKYSVNEKFSTRDRDQDGWSDVHCAQGRQGPWWYDSGCGYSNLNGRYRDGGDEDRTGIWWYTWRKFESLKKVEMKIRPT
ncbi:microfibril-associated glycoprotein 4-like [Amphibalanus amphitrite]|uniref:microfibril-associated glycoprotein 4-like n=1 Tax=Amphibalanus amphitrite TaxID=1232801 RepID=UPI001C90A051|nr:microfibril-associated glycoprotein 4-like [Amphibalanus amphitrite]